MNKLPYSVWPDLAQHAQKMQDRSLRQMFEGDPDRAHRYTIGAAGIYLDYSKNFFDADTQQLLVRLNNEANVVGLARQMFEGAALNNTEVRPALHTLLRARVAPAGLEDKYAEVTSTLQRVKDISDAIRSGAWKSHSGETIQHIIHLGIGGSYLGPKMVDEALASNRQPPGQDIDCHYVANVDAHHLTRVLASIDPKRTLVIVVSKSFSTLETKTNAETTRKWLLTEIDEAGLSAHVIAISSNFEDASAFGIHENNILPMWDWVGGRYSVWSAVGIPIAIRYGFEVFRQFLDGAAEMDEHFISSEPKENLPMVMAFLSIFYQHCFGAGTHAVLSYDHRLRYLPDHLQQVDMESNGKGRNVEGKPLDYDSGSIIWGGEGTNGQHAFHQLLHQGTRFTGIDFVMTLLPDHQLQDHHDKLVASCLSQSQALMQGRRLDEVSDASSELQREHKVMPGNRPSNTLTLERLDARRVGSLVALYEHKVFCQAAIWHINPFDQWGVELGKELGDRILNAMLGGNEILDGSTQALLDRYTTSRTASRKS
ncbi:MAG: glucose-6-phosphate isomerase [Patiriisocius sp.]|jgi:glucose-6-phosphate isomerase